VKLARHCTLAAALAVCAATAVNAQAVSPLDYGTQSLADVRLGVALAAVAELVDAPALLARPSSQSFIDDAFARVLASTDDPLLRAHVPRDRDDLRVDAGARFDRGRADRDLVSLVHDVLHALPAPRDRLFAVGLIAQQCAYNARVLRSPANDVELRRALASANVADTLVSGLHDLRERTAAIARGRWREVADAADAIVAAIVGAGATPPFPRTSGVWLVLFRAQPTSLAARRGTPRFYFDVVRFDGTHRTIGAYPAGDGGFGHAAPSLVCGFDREGDAATERAVPIVPELGSTDAQLGDDLAARCVSEAKGSWRYRVRGATDARFIIDVLVHTVTDAPAVLHEVEGR
jgi:hypothetical protein